METTSQSNSLFLPSIRTSNDVQGLARSKSLRMKRTCKAQRWGRHQSSQGMTFSSKLAAHVLAVARAPITATCFAGDDVRYASEYELLEQELGKASALHSAGCVDWETVRQGC